MVTDIPPAAVDFHCSSVLESVLEQPAVRDALLARGGGDIDGLAQRAMWKCSSGVSRKAPIRAGDHLGHWVVAGAVAEAEAAGDDDGSSGGASGSVAAAWSILREPCARCAGSSLGSCAERGPGGGAARAAAAPPPPRAATDGRVDGAAADRALLAAVGSAAGALIRQVLRGRGRRRHTRVARLLHRGGLCECGGGGAPRVLDGPACGVAWSSELQRAVARQAVGRDHRPAQAHRLARARARAAAARRARSADGRRRTRSSRRSDPTAATRSTTSGGGPRDHRAL